MSTPASPSAAPSAEYTEHLSNLVAIPSLSHEHLYFLGPIGNPDSTEFIIAETNRIPFRLANPNLGHWKNIFKSWPSLEKTTPEKTNSAKDEPLMASAAYFWSNILNAFLFNQGPMTPTLLDITMITGGWSGYVAAYMGKGSVTPREHTAFLLMWLEKFLFCGSSCGPTTNWQFLAKALETKKQIPLGKILLDYLYQMLSNASAKIATGSVVGAGGPWWLLQSWLNLVVMKVVNRPSLIDAEFPRLEPITSDDGEDLTHHRCIFYDGFQKDAQVWFPYEDSVNFDLQSDFRLEDINSENFDKSREVFLAAISPCILPVGIHQGRNIQVSYEFYHPMSSARQFGMGQLLIGLYFADKIQCRGEISPTLMMDRLLNLPRPSLGSIDNIELERFSSRNFDRWWGEWKQHIFHQSASMYMIDLFPDVVPQTTESSPPRKSNSGRDIEYVSRPEIH
uniref:Aminotransferase-like plant mobile domain-containing protein n=1 Tax=Oryza sativa subsp. japonica TaxID=39947 RepID=Q8LM76_ORYSJ|nr:Hypothetical protein [Oryza sativa Japonica Group]